ncbi:MAG TPA: methionine adenosyltransferase [Anaerohalosphaeraceae bacterium]|nr:methionine adenosyltransferase [Anaerohalosphaeraceae bacterium]HQG05006.1 methionine adenosyltransferase [Anaerohalosphaeraceae bacterium]HQI07851.1 methionine adenosyltransferase [Anaerohalosphaeraceae bacterium]HQJ68212.1 methionine adenosyltransferase [Anaerohalosphaeraceae bacterium]
MRKSKSMSSVSSSQRCHLFTSESVTMGHPDKIADQISDAVLDAMLAQDPNSRVACETLVSTGMTLIAGEITSKAVVDIPQLARDTIRKIGYTDPAIGFDADNCAILVTLKQQSPDIAMGVDRGGAGDQGLMFGYACRETAVYMPLPIYLAHEITSRLAKLRQTGKIKWLRPDGKSQVTVEYGENKKPKRIHTVVCSTQHDASVVNKKTDQMSNQARKEIIEKVILPVLPKKLVDNNTIFHINPTGRFEIGGPKGDCGLTGRKIIVDTYGGRGSHGGGAFSGKDPSKVDRSASYMARYIAKNIVAAGLADTCEIQLSYAIGIAEPVSILVNTEQTAKIDESRLEALVRKFFPLTPRGMISHLKLLRPIYAETARNGHFGRKHPDFTWEKTDMAAKLRNAAGLR